MRNDSSRQGEAGKTFMSISNTPYPRSAIQQYWTELDPKLITTRQPECDMLLQMIRRPGSIAEVVAQPGMGKTTMLKAVAENHRHEFGGVVEYIAAGSGFAIDHAVDNLAERFRTASGQSLLVIDAAENIEPGEILSVVKRLETGLCSFSTLIGSCRATGLGDRITLEPFPRRGIQNLLTETFGAPPAQTDVDRFMMASQGIPSFARLFIDQLKAGASLDDIERLVLPWRSQGLLGPSGRPFDGRHPRGRHLFSEVRLINSKLIDEVSQNPAMAYRLSSRQFEELTASLLVNMGYEVQLTSRTRDGGKDLYAVRKDGLGSFMFIVECKRYGPHNHVGVGVVRSLHGVAQHERANGAIVMTTSFFTEPAKQFARALKGQMSLKDFVDLQTWLREAKQPR